MREIEINLVEKRPKEPKLNKWNKRLKILLGLTLIWFFFNLGFIFIAKISVSANNQDLAEERAELAKAIEQRKKTEGLYLTLLSRLKDIETAEKNTYIVELIPEEIDKLIGGLAEVNLIEIDNNIVEVEVVVNSAETLREVVGKMTNKLTNPIVEESEIDEAGLITASIKLQIKKL